MAEGLETTLMLNGHTHPWIFPLSQTEAVGNQGSNPFSIKLLNQCLAGVSKTYTLRMYMESFDEVLEHNCTYQINR